ncbi:MAG: dihydrofolate reductase family protein [Omnitrophica WOR_2 bacterium]
MRKLIYFTMASLDGFMDKPDRNLDWIIVDEELHTSINQREREVGVYLYGRRMYELMQAYWPTADTQSSLPFEAEFSRIWKEIPKIVFSTTLERVEGNARLVRGNVVEEVTRLKEQPGKDIEVGGANLASTLIRSGLVDEYRIFVQPVVLGAGTPMFPALDQAIKLRLIESRPFSTGVVFLRYRSDMQK